jgi:hypothetical protein
MNTKYFKYKMVLYYTWEREKYLSIPSSSSLVTSVAPGDVLPVVVLK